MLWFQGFRPRTKSWNMPPATPRTATRPTTKGHRPAPRPAALLPHWQTVTGAVRLYHGHTADVLARLPAASVQCVVTSPPYWGLRSYLPADHPDKAAEVGSEERPDCLEWATGTDCGACFVCRLRAVLRGLWRVMRDDGTLWLNLGDSYSTSGGHTTGEDYEGGIRNGRSNNGSRTQAKGKVPAGIPSGNLVGVPWRVALAAQADGWTLRQDIIWNKPAPMPESVRNRCTKAHEYIFLLTKQRDYYYDHEAIKEPAAYYRPAANGRGETPKYADVQPSETLSQVSEDRNKRSVWRMSSPGYPGAHFATFPPELPRTCILAGTSEHGCCKGCGTPYTRVVESTKLTRKRPNEYVKRTGEDGTGNSCSNTVAGTSSKTLGWARGNGCTCTTDEVVPCVVLDPFVGSGTTLEQALALGRHGIGIDLSAEYLEQHAAVRVNNQVYRMGGYGA